MRVPLKKLRAARRSLVWVALQQAERSGIDADVRLCDLSVSAVWSGKTVARSRLAKSLSTGTKATTTGLASAHGDARRSAARAARGAGKRGCGATGGARHCASAARGSRDLRRG